MIDYKSQVEALLFASGRVMDIDTLITLTGASGKGVILSNMTKLKEEYEKRDSPMMVVEEKGGYKLTVREAFLPLVRKIVSETELPKTILETLAVIAWKSPVLQSEVVEVRHNKAYEHVAELLELGFIKKESQGRSYLINLTEKFYNYFDVDGSKSIREVFNKVVGAPDQRKVDEFGNIGLPGVNLQIDTDINVVKEVPLDDEFGELDEIQENNEQENIEDEFGELNDAEESITVSKNES